MPKVTLMPGGIKAAMGPRIQAGGGVRGECEGWSVGAARRNDVFLRSVDPKALDGYPVGLTFTLRNCPETPAEWEAMRRALVERLRRMGMIRLHWITEFQPRDGYGGVPHLHGMVMLKRAKVWDGQDQIWLPAEEAIKDAWMDIAKSYDVSRLAQHVHPVPYVHGWFFYLSKHCTRGVNHVQRNRKNVPANWQKTGRVWGKSGDWPVSAETYEASEEALFLLRRLMRALVFADARRALLAAPASPEALKRFKALHRRHRRAHATKTRSRIIPVSEWWSEQCSSAGVIRWMEKTLHVREDVDLETGEVRNILDRRYD